jgi:hypothetical protein
MLRKPKRWEDHSAGAKWTKNPVHTLRVPEGWVIKVLDAGGRAPEDARMGAVSVPRTTRAGSFELCASRALRLRRDCQHISIGIRDSSTSGARDGTRVALCLELTGDEISTWL